MPPDVGPSCSGELRGLDIQERGTLEWGKMSGYCTGLLHSYCSAPPHPRRPSPQEYHQNCKEGLLGAWSGGKLGICGLDLALRCVLFGPHSVLKET